MEEEVLERERRGRRGIGCLQWLFWLVISLRKTQHNAKEPKMVPLQLL